MAALFINRISKLSNNARFFSSLPESPYLMLGGKKLGDSLEGKIVQHRFFDPKTETRVYNREKIFPKELIGRPLIGASRGWVASFDNKDFTVHLTDLYKACVSSPRIISLPSVSMEFKPTTHATEVSLSSSDLVQDDFTVAAKFNEYMISVCRPRWDSKWTHIPTPYSLLPASELIYSKRDRVFYVTSHKGLYLASLDLQKNELDHRYIRLRNHPKISEAGWEMLDTCVKTNHLVESPSGELFYIKWYHSAYTKRTKMGIWSLSTAKLSGSWCLGKTKRAISFATRKMLEIYASS